MTREKSYRFHVMNEEMQKYALNDYEGVLAFALDSSDPQILAVLDETNCYDSGE